jgi:HPt (histidine-containing phosphotransfer) domain-containing protein
MAEEFPKATWSIEQALAELEGLAAAIDLAQNATIVRGYAAVLEQLGDAAADAGLLGLLEACVAFRELLGRLDDDGEPLSEETCDALRDWPTILRSYLEAPDDPANATALVDHLCRPCWAVTISPEDGAELVAALVTMPGVFDDTSLSGPPGEGERTQLDADGERALLESGEATSFDALGERTSLQSAEETSLAEQAERTSLEAEIDAADEFFVLDFDRGDAGDTNDSGTGEASRHGAGAAPEGVAPPRESDGDALFAPDDDTVIRPSPLATQGTVKTLPRSAQELIEILLGELPQVETALLQAMQLEGAVAGGPAPSTTFVSHAVEVFQRLAGAAEAIGLTGLAQACNCIADNLAASEPPGEQHEAAREAWRQCVPALRAYLQDPLAVECAMDIAALLATPQWPAPLDASASEVLVQLLMHPDFSSVVAEVAARPEMASAEDVSLAIPADVNPDLLDGLLHELPLQTEQFSAAIQRLISGGSLDDVHTAQRIAHTLKGAGNTVGVRDSRT